MGLNTPAGFVFDEFYAADACWYVHSSESLCMTDQEITVVHPPLGKWLIGLGIRLFGFSPGGWRVASAVAGTVTVAALYVLARNLLRSTLGASLGAGLLAIDFLHVVMSRTAMLDVFVTGFGVLAFLFLAWDVERPPTSGGSGPLGFGRPWRLAAGLAAGAAAACKWSGWPILAAVIVVTIVREIDRRRRDGRGRPVARTFREEFPSIAIALIGLPVIVYAASYAGRLEGTLLAWPWSEGSWLRALVERQAFMWEFHLGLDGEHPYASPAWSWLLLKRPVLFYFTMTSDRMYREILAMGSPLVWWAAVVALLHVGWPGIRDPFIRAARGTIVAGFLAGFLPWLMLGGVRGQTFLYLILPAVPFMCLALGAVAARIGRSGFGRGVVAAFAAVSMGLFLFYVPLLTSVPLSYASWRARILFTDCGPDASQRGLEPRTEPGPPPGGWCWE
jgi:dolichyl-phosphate-mannose-protein mannosyltransferase